MPIMGLVENMSGFICAHCGQESAIFKKDGGKRTAVSMGVPFLGSIPFDMHLMELGDQGQAYLLHNPAPAVQEALEGIIEKIIAVANQSPKETKKPLMEVLPMMNPKNITLDSLKIAIPMAEGVLCNHFGHCEQFALIDLQGKNIIQKVTVTPPPHEPGLLPRWLGEKGVNLIIAGGMGQRAVGLFTERGIKVLTGAPQLPPDELISHYVNQTLVTGANVCDH
jgi:ATP-binding protein involved in chromosome partitioning